MWLDFSTKWYYNIFMRKIIGRPKEFDEEEALKKAMYYFWEHGYESASLADLLDTMGIKKSSFYQTFGSKEALFKASLSLYTENSSHYIGELKEQFGAKGALVELMRMLLAEVKETGKSKGCLVMNSGGECYAKFGHLSSLVKEKFKAFQTLFMRYIIEAQASGEIANKSDPFELTTLYQSFLNGGSALVRAGAEEREIAVLLSHVEALLA